MALVDSSFSVNERLSVQLHALSKLTEKLTLRLLQMEERVTELESRLEVSSEAKDPISEKMLDDNEIKFKALDGLLSRGETNLSITDGENFEPSEKKSLSSNLDSISQEDNSNQQYIDTEYINESDSDLLAS